VLPHRRFASRLTRDDRLDAFGGSVILSNTDQFHLCLLAFVGLASCRQIDQRLPESNSDGDCAAIGLLSISKARD
jgi:hypothetical protein